MRSNTPNFAFKGIRLIVAFPATLAVYSLEAQKFEQKQIINTSGKAYEKLVHVVESQRVFAAAADGSVCEVRRQTHAWTECLTRPSLDNLELLTAPLEASSLLPNFTSRNERLLDLQIDNRSEYLYTLITTRGEAKVSVYNIKANIQLETSFKFSHILSQLQEQLGGRNIFSTNGLQLVRIIPLSYSRQVALVETGKGLEAGVETHE